MTLSSDVQGNINKFIIVNVKIFFAFTITTQRISPASIGGGGYSLVQ